jgi:hypothetical protein
MVCTKYPGTDDAEHWLLPLFSDYRKGSASAGQPDKEFCSSKFGSCASSDAAGESRPQGQFFDIVKTGRKGNVDGEVLAVWG